MSSALRGTHGQGFGTRETEGRVVVEAVRGYKSCSSAGEVLACEMITFVCTLAMTGSVGTL